MQTQVIETPRAAWSRSILTDHEQEKYNLARGILASVSNREAIEQGSARRVTSFETEVSDALQRASLRESHGGLWVPWSLRHCWLQRLQHRTGLDSSTATAGQELVEFPSRQYESHGKTKFVRTIDFTTHSGYDSFQSAALEAIRRFRFQSKQQAEPIRSGACQ